MTAVGPGGRGFTAPGPVRELPQQDQPGVRHDARAAARDFKTAHLVSPVTLCDNRGAFFVAASGQIWMAADMDQQS